MVRQVFLSMLTIISLVIPLQSPQAQIVKGTETAEKEVVTLRSDEIVDEDYFAIGNTVEIHGTINGDLYAAARKVIVEGSINGDVIVTAGSVNISGKVSQDARIAGGKITITGNIRRNVSVAGGYVEILAPAGVGGSILAFGGELVLSAPVGGKVKAAAGELLISDKVDGDVEAAAGKIRLTADARINGNLTYSSEEEISLDPGAVISGTVTRKDSPGLFDISPEKLSVVFFGTYIFTAFVNFFSTLLIGLVLLNFCPEFMRRTVELLREKTLSSVGAGFLTVILTPIIIISLMLTILVIPLALILTGIYLIYLYVSRVFVIYWAGHLIFKKSGKESSSGWVFFTGLIVFTVLSVIPVIGGIITFLATVFGLGSLLLTKMEFYRS